MMLKLQGNPPMLMKRDGKEVKLSSRLASIVDRCVDPKPSNRLSAHRLLSYSFFKVRASHICYMHVFEHAYVYNIDSVLFTHLSLKFLFFPLRLASQER